MHAGWNAVVRLGLDRFSSILLLTLVQSGLSLLALPFVPVPAAEVWPWIIASNVLHTGYKAFLVSAYEHGDLSQVYPLARGAAPLVVAVAGALLLGEATTITKTFAVVTIALGVIVMSLKGGSGLSRMPARAFGFALGSACFTAAYTLVDGVGARLSGNASGYAFWMFFSDGLFMLAYALLRRGPGILPNLLPAWRSGIVAGGLSLGSYWIAIWAFTKAPIALVAALRETSVLFAMLIAMVVLKEPAGRWRWTAALLIGSGVILMRV